MCLISLVVGERNHQWRKNWKTPQLTRHCLKEKLRRLRMLRRLQSLQDAPDPRSCSLFRSRPQRRDRSPRFRRHLKRHKVLPNPPSRRTRGSAAKVVALALCCSLAGGAVGAGSVICLNAFGIRVRPGMKIVRMINGGQGRTGRRDRNNNRNDQERSANNNGSGYSFKNRGGNDGSRRKGTGRNGQYRDNVQPDGRYNFGHGRRSQGESNIKGKDQGTTTPDKGSDPTTQTPPETQQTTPSAGGEAKA